MTNLVVIIQSIGLNLKDGRLCCPCCRGPPGSGPGSGRRGMEIAGSALRKLPITHNTVSISPFNGRQKQETASRLRNNDGFEEIIGADINPELPESLSNLNRGSIYKAEHKTVERVYPSGGEYDPDEDPYYNKRPNSGMERGQLKSVDSRTPAHGPSPTMYSSRGSV
ncbi:hypothetical protein OSTOST_15344, partial [Ostertagia ostertagi]